MKWLKKGGRSIVFTIFFVASLALSFGAWAERPEDPGGGPPNEKGRKPTNPGGTQKGDLLGDLWVVVRDVAEGDGAPIKFSWTWNAACYNAEGDFDATLPGCAPVSSTVDPNGCSQPITYEDVSGLATQFTYANYVNSYGDIETVNLIPLDPECKIPAGYEGTWGEQTIEVESGRLNMARTTSYVLESAYAEALANINSASSITLDPAGRLLLSLPDLTDPEGIATYEKVVDSPRENLALYQTMMLGMKNGGEGCLPDLKPDFLDPDLAHLICGATVDDPDNDLQRAASFLAGAADKSGDVGTDEVIYLNSILGINQVVVNEADGSIVVAGYFDFKDDFAYDRSAEYSSERTADLILPQNRTDPTYPFAFYTTPDVNIYTNVFAGDWEGDDYPVINFVRAADDSVKTINFVHAYELPAHPIPLAR